METNIEQRSAIKFCWKAGKTGMETYELLRKAYGKEWVSRATMFLWFGKFWDGCEDVYNDEWAGHSHTGRTGDNIAAVHAVLQHDRQSMVHLLEEQLHINQETIHHIITEHLGKKNLCSLRAARINGGAKSRPCGLVRRPSCGASSRPGIFDHNCDGDKSWCFGYDPTTKWQSAE